MEWLLGGIAVLAVAGLIGALWRRRPPAETTTTTTPDNGVLLNPPLGVESVGQVRSPRVLKGGTEIFYDHSGNPVAYHVKRLTVGVPRLEITNWFNFKGTGQLIPEEDYHPRPGHGQDPPLFLIAKFTNCATMPEPGQVGIQSLPPGFIPIGVTQIKYDDKETKWRDAPEAMGGTVPVYLNPKQSVLVRLQVEYLGPEAAVAHTILGEDGGEETILTPPTKVEPISPAARQVVGEETAESRRPRRRPAGEEPWPAPARERREPLDGRRGLNNEKKNRLLGRSKNRGSDGRLPTKNG